MKKAAYKAYSKALRDGTLKRQPCEVCGSILNIHGHHADYSKPLEVQWLCARHHLETHGVNPKKPKQRRRIAGYEPASTKIPVYRELNPDDMWRLHKRRKKIT